MLFSHETLRASRGRRTDFPIIVAIHSTILGPAVGGCRVKDYGDFSSAVADCLLLAEAMTYKAAAVDNGTGGGKSVACVPKDWAGFSRHRDRAPLFLDIADIVAELVGQYHVAPDVGSTPDDMGVVRRRTPYVAGLPLSLGGAGGTAYGTAIGVFAALELASSTILGSQSLRGATIALQGFGGVGSLLCDLLTKAGASVVATDIDLSKRQAVEQSGAKWVAPETICAQDCDVFMPCALGGILDDRVIADLRCKLVVGAANNQLARPESESLMTQRGIVYIPDFVANAGGLAYSSGIEIHGLSAQASSERLVTRITGALRTAFDMRDEGLSLTRAAYRIAEDRLRDGGYAGPSALPGPDGNA
ncbi:Glu/Leu/Phe/Val dehydrogenase dimerization domain-containing protein [Neorhizobium sp. JUb45]|uniref:Glu/Leu/Phe/Val dehydrogenase dimerization domain-containing protein n=1 Tax=Neorhizobium sp. JUb45 TaxID=2485113 RepID=UPI0010458730|nr:Glu/Leu/Phe/Val dehydrogenase dimerization domain-containing protein [Neorhizobium sp. JUb45]TCQ99055.1 leucine dehydrogenase [Neorhizobium sp. JUb45]